MPNVVPRTVNSALRASQSLYSDSAKATLDWSQPAYGAKDSNTPSAADLAMARADRRAGLPDRGINPETGLSTSVSDSILQQAQQRGYGVGMGTVPRVQPIVDAWGQINTDAPWSSAANRTTPGSEEANTQADQWAANQQELEIRRWGEDFSKRMGLQIDDPQTQDSINALWNNLESMRQANMAMSAQMIADSIAQAALPYDEKLQQIGRSIEDTRGRMNDLEKITDWYQASIVGTWEKAAQAGRAVNGDSLKNAMAGRIAEVGKVYDLANENTQTYLDQIGGVPLAQRMAIEDSISELQGPYEGLMTADIQGMINITLAEGNLLEKSANWGLAHAQFESEASEFGTHGLMQRAIDMLEQDRTDTIGQRNKAVSLAERMAEAQYGYTEQMPARDDFVNMALSSALGTFDAIEQQGYMDMFYDFQSGNSPFMQATGIQDPETGEMGMAGMPIKSLAQLEAEFSKLDPAEQAAWHDDFQVMAVLFATQERAGQSWDGRNSYYKGAGGKKGGQAPNNAANWIAQTPEYVERQRMVAGIRQQITTMFPGMTTGTQQMRDISPDGTYGKHQNPNSDHLSGGALDIFPVSVAAGRKIQAEMESWENVSFTVYQSAGHYDHIHVSFRLPGDFGPTAQVPSSGLAEEPPPAKAPIPNERRSLLDGYRDKL